MFLVKCIPFVGTAVNAAEAVGALCNGDGKEFFSKLAETAVGAGMDTVFVLSGGASSILSAPLKGGVLEIGKVATKKGVEKLLIQEGGRLVTNAAVRGATNVMLNNGKSHSFHGSWSSGSSWSSSNGGYNSPNTSNTSTSTSTGNGTGNSSGVGNGSGDPPRDINKNLPNQHAADYDAVIDASGVITDIVLGPNGRVEQLKAAIKKCHLRPRGEPRRTVTTRVQRFVDAMGRVVGGVQGVRDSDEAGHIIGDSLGGPHNMTYNFFPQSPHCNLEYYNRVERQIYEYLNQNGSNSRVRVSVQLVYVDYNTDQSPNRPRAIQVHVQYSNGLSFYFEYSNA